MPEPMDKLHNVWGRLFQAAMWRRYAMQWRAGDPFVREVLRAPYQECLRRARINAYLARRLNRRRLTAKGDSDR